MNQDKAEKQRVRKNFNSSPGFFGGSEIDHEAPIPVCDCISYLRQRSFFEIGVFRIPGNNDIVEKLKNNYNTVFGTKQAKETNDTSILNNSSPTPGVNDVASLLKSYFKELPAPLIPAVATQALVQIVHQGYDKAEEAKRFSYVVKQIKSPERECLGLIISFLRELCSFRKFNNMNADNLSTCFVLSIMGGGDAFDQLFLLREGAQVIRKLIGLPVRMYMPSISNVKKNTKYRHIDDTQEIVSPSMQMQPIPQVPPQVPPRQPANDAPPPVPARFKNSPNRYEGMGDPGFSLPPPSSNRGKQQKGYGLPPPPGLTDNEVTARSSAPVVNSSKGSRRKGRQQRSRHTRQQQPEPTVQEYQGLELWEQPNNGSGRY